MIKQRLIAAICATALMAGGPSWLGRSAGSWTVSLEAGQKKTVHVKEYTKKDGTKVKAHDRKAPEKHATTPKAEKPTPKAHVTASPSSVARDQQGRIQRSAAVRHRFARMTGYPNGRPGWIIDHVVPLACGGADDVSNLQWQTIAEAKAKDRTERVGC